MVTSKTTLQKILEKKGAEKILEKRGVPCVSCPMAKFEMEKEPYGESAHWRQIKIGEICKMYGLNLEKILKDLNREYRYAKK